VSNNSEIVSEHAAKPSAIDWIVIGVSAEVRFASYPPAIGLSTIEKGERSMDTEVGLVSCTKSKHSEPAPPRDLYEPSALFRKARAYCEAIHDEWFVISAKHGLLAPDGPPIEPYDETVTNAPIERRREWAQRVVTEMDENGLLNPADTIVIHAGKAYYGELLPLLGEHNVTVELPLEGLRYGERLRWYDEQQ
jgi:hypothetical protein